MAAAKRKGKQSKKVLPHWDLSHLVPAPAGKNIEKTIRRCAMAALAFQKRYKGRLSRLSPAEFARAIALYEKISEELGRVYSYASLDKQTKMNNPAASKLYQSVMEKVTAVTADLLFFQLEINRLADLSAKIKNPEARRYKPFLDQVRAFKAYQLPDDVEKNILERSVVGNSAWVRLFDETVARLRFPVGKKMLTETEIFHMFLSRRAEERKAAAKAAEKVFGENIETFSFIMNTLVKEKDIDDAQRGFGSVIAARNLDNQVGDEVVDALIQAVRRSYPRLSHRYYKLKAKWLGKKKLDYWDRNAPLPFSADKKFSWQAAKEAVLTAYDAFSPEMASIGARFFNEGWIDAAPRPGKDSGAFSASTVPAAHPYILMNYKGGIEDVMTLAHELGHGVHQVLAAKQGYLMADTPLTLAETASVFGEMLTFRSLLKQEKNIKNRKAMLAKKVEDMLNTVVRQVAFHEFEWAVHNARKKGELSADDICGLWMKAMKSSLGPAFRFDEGYKYYWAYISHFYHTPFYVYAYAFGDCLVNALYAVYEESGQGFSGKYIALLEAGGTKKYDELLTPFGLDARDPKFWAKGLSVIEGFITELEEMN